MDSGLRYAGWFLLDIRLASSVALFSVALACIVLALWFRGRRWDEYVVGFLAVFSLTVVGMLLLTNGVAHFPAIRIESLFPVP